MAQDDDAALLRGELLDELADVGAGLLAHDLLLDILVVDTEGVDNVAVGTVGDEGHLADTAEVVDDEVVGDAHHPVDELVLVLVVAGIDGVDDLVEGLLKDVVGDILILDYREDVAIDLRLIPGKQYFEARVITFFVT